MRVLAVPWSSFGNGSKSIIIINNNNYYYNNYYYSSVIAGGGVWRHKNALTPADLCGKTECDHQEDGLCQELKATTQQLAADGEVVCAALLMSIAYWLVWLYCSLQKVAPEMTNCVSGVTLNLTHSFALCCFFLIETPLM